MNENVLQPLQQFIQDVLVPDVRELKVRIGVIEKQIGALEKQIGGLEKQMEYQYNLVRDQMNMMRDQQDAQFKAIMAAIAESRAQSNLDTFKLIAGLSERMAVLEAAAK